MERVLGAAQGTARVLGDVARLAQVVGLGAAVLIIGGALLARMRSWTPTSARLGDGGQQVVQRTDV